MTDNASRRISDRVLAIRLTGYFMPIFEPHQPVLVGMPGSDDLFIFVFSTEAKLVATMMSFGIEYKDVAIVTDGRGLLDEIGSPHASGDRPYRIRLAVDPYKADNGRARFIEPLPPQEQS